MANSCLLTSPAVCPLPYVEQVVETAVSLAIIRLGVAKFEPLPSELFKYDLGCAWRGQRTVGCGTLVLCWLGVSGGSVLRT